MDIGVPDAERVFAVPRIVGPALTGLECDEEGFILTREAGLFAPEHLPRWLAEHGIVTPAAEPSGGVTVRRSLSALRAPEYQYLFELSRAGASAARRAPLRR